MRVAVTSTGTTPESGIDQRFGRAKYFLIYDSDTEVWSAVDNTQDLSAAHGAGIQAAQKVVDRDVSAVITGNCGPKAFTVLNAAKVAVYQGGEGPVKEAVAALKSGTLPAASESSVEAGFGSI